MMSLEIPKQSEAAFQQQCRIWFHNTYPALRGLLFHVRNNAHNARDGEYWKQLGVVPGVSDFIFLYGGKCYCIELKTPRGYQSEEQLLWEKLVKNQNINYFVVNSIESFKALINHIIIVYERQLQK
jgi:hypothetical protein